MKSLIKFVALGTLLSAPFAMAAHHGGEDNQYGHKDGHGKKMHCQHKKHGHHSDIRGMLKGLDLSAEQKSQVKALMEKAKAERMKPDTAQFEAHLTQHNQLMSAPNFDEALAKQLISERQTKMAEKELKQLKLKHDVIQILTPEQKAKLEARQQKRVEKFRAHHGG